MKVSEEELNHAYDTEFEGTELIDAVEELLNLRKRVEELEEINNALQIHKFQSETWFKHLEKQRICHVDFPHVP